MQRWVTQNKSQDCLGSLKKQGSWPSLSLQRHFTSHPRGSFSSKNKWLCPRYLTLSWRYSLSRWPWDALIMSSPDMRAHLGSCHYNHLVIKPSLEQKWWITAPAVTHLQCRPETRSQVLQPTFTPGLRRSQQASSWCMAGVVQGQGSSRDNINNIKLSLWCLDWLNYIWMFFKL